VAPGGLFAAGFVPCRLAIWVLLWELLGFIIAFFVLFGAFLLAAGSD
jgi:hypothetical protein